MLVLLAMHLEIYWLDVMEILTGGFAILKEYKNSLKTFLRGMLYFVHDDYLIINGCNVVAQFPLFTRMK